MMLEHYFNRLVEASPVRYYVSGADGARVYWPWRMNKAKSREFRQAFVDACDHHILDSNFKDASVTNRDVLDEAVEKGSDGAVLADVYQDAEATIDALLDGLELVDDHRFDGVIVLPLQQPYEEVYKAVLPSVDGNDVWWALGGLKDASATSKIEAAVAFRHVVGSDAHIHGLGWGPTPELARAVRRDPLLIDSIDNSTAVDNSIGGLAGPEQASVVAARAQAKRIEWLRSMTKFAAEADDPPQLRSVGQLSLQEASAVPDGGEQP